MGISQADREKIAAAYRADPDISLDDATLLIGLPISKRMTVARTLGDLRKSSDPNYQGAHHGRSPSKKQQQQEARAERLEEPATEPGPDDASGPKQKGGAWHPKSFLAPMYGDLARLGVAGLGRLTYRITKGRAPMRVQEALVISARALRILDRRLAKYVRIEFKASEDGEDLAAMVAALGFWAFAALVAAVFKQDAQPQQQQTPAGLGAPAQDIPESDLFAGSEPAARGNAGATPDPAQAAFPGTAPVGISDDADLFTGSEPLAPTPGDTAGGAGRIQGTPQAQANGRATGASDAVWALVSPTDLGQAMEG